MTTYPPTPRGDVVEDLHGTRIADPYRWLEQTDAPAVREWIAAQNLITREWLDAVPARGRIVERLTALWDHPRTGVPWRRGARWFQLRNTGLENQDVLWTMDGPEQRGRVLLDPNGLSEDGTVSLAIPAVSHDGELLAYATTTAGSDWLTWRVREVATGEDRTDLLRWSKFSGAAWTHDRAGFFYGAYDAPAGDAIFTQRNDGMRLQYHRLGEPQDADRVVLAWPHDPEWAFSPQVTTDGRLLLIHLWRGTERLSRLWVADLEAGEEPRPLIDEFDAMYSVAGTDGDLVYVQTDLDAPLGRVLAIDVRTPDRSQWREVVPESADRLQSTSLIGGRLVTLVLHDASHRLRLWTLDGDPDGEVDLGELASVGGLSGREDDRRFYFSSSSFTRSTRVASHDLDTGETATVVPPWMAAEGFAARQVFVTSGDGTRVPMFLVHRDGLTPTGDAPTLLYGYGGYDISLTPSFSLPWLVWLELGGLVAVANLRGGGEYGAAWHDAGRLANKQHVFDDFVACAEWLIGQGWTRTDRLAINGGSNGGLLVGACLTQRPDLFGACAAEVGVFDMLRFHKFTIGWAWTSDYGSPDDPDQFRTLLAYSPLHNLRPGTAYPPTLIVTGDHDDRVVPGHSFKFAAAMQAAQAGDNPVLLRVETAAGHGHGTPTGVLIAQRADVLTFLLRALRVTGV